ncbi:hypothetical protein GQ44DRAFT_729248 [Phaeosphaeriaceae sp. PMI808]|nr:hypothetical protein GQ44DRAFT_729248 [Phaeosphaeriaceae sp. PMI808]
MGVGETITVINKSGKVVSSSKHIVNVFKEAKAAYRERKAEIKVEKEAAYQAKKLTEGVRTLHIDDDVQSRASSRHSKHSRATHRTKAPKSTHARPSMERGYTDSFYANDAPRSNRHRFEEDLAGSSRDAHRMEITRRNSDMHVQRSPAARRQSVDLDLAYGDIPPPLPEKNYDDGELKEKASRITMLLDEANCLQYSVTQTIENLQKNPEALAAVSLTLAEISTIVGKMGPGVLLTLKGAFPAVAALLLSPQFMIAGGVAVGVTIVALGGYKIIKKIQADSGEKAAMPAAPIPMTARTRVDSGADLNMLDELEPAELSRVELWRRGIADVEAESAGTTVDGEFVTPGASRQLIDAGVLDEDDLKSRRSMRIRDDGERRPKSHRARSERSVKTSKTSETRKTKTVVKDGASSVGSTSGKKKKAKEPSGLKMLFRSHTSHV